MYLLAIDVVFCLCIGVPLKNCKELYDKDFRKSGLYLVNPCKCGSVFVVYCDMNLQGGGWTIIQRRVNDKLSYYQDYKTYQHGFGDFAENFWLGLDKLNCLTESADLNNDLYIGLDTFHSLTSYAWYDGFSVGKESDGYRLSIGQYNAARSSAGDSMSEHNNQRFSTYDQDQDSHDDNCASLYKGGWWYNRCYESNLNGQYYHGVVSNNIRDGVVWKTWLGTFYSLKATVIAIR